MPVNIRGKQYLTVAERVTMIHAKHPEGVSIETEIISHSETDALVKASVTIGERRFTGHAHEVKSDNPKEANYKAFLENAETSALGRALAAAGLSGSEYASAEEITAALGSDPSNPIRQLRDMRERVKVADETERELTKQLVALREELRKVKEQTALAKASDQLSTFAGITDQSERRHQLLNTCENLAGEAFPEILKRFPESLSGADALRLLLVCHLLA